LLTLTNMVSACLPSVHNAGRATAAAILPEIAALNSLLAEASAPPILPSRNLDFFNPTAPAVVMMGVEIAGGLTEDAAQILADARALAIRQRDAVLAWAIAHPVGLVTRLRDRLGELRARIGEALGRLAAVPAGAADRLNSFLLGWVQQWDRSWRNFTDSLMGLGTTAAYVGAAGTGMLLALALLVFLILKK
jgi:hypothetical protein